MHSDLKKWCKKYKAVEKTIDYFWENIETFRKEEPEDYKECFENNISDIGYRLDDISYRLAIPRGKWGRVYITLDILFKNQKIGWFQQIYDLDGSPFNEYFVLSD